MSGTALAAGPDDAINQHGRPEASALPLTENTFSSAQDKGGGDRGGEARFGPYAPVAHSSGILRASFSFWTSAPEGSVVLVESPDPA